MKANKAKYFNPMKSNMKSQLSLTFEKAAVRNISNTCITQAGKAKKQK